jgi:ketosteroid isomerase-like protein
MVHCFALSPKFPEFRFDGSGRYGLMDDKYKINAARTEMREAYLSGDADRLLSVFHPDGFTDMSEGNPSKYGSDARLNLAQEATKLFASYSVKFVPIIIDISTMDGVAFDRGWQEFILTPKAGGETIRKRYRYFDTWKKVSNGDWKITLHVNNTDVPEEVGGILSTWFLTEKAEAAAR